MRPFVRSTAPHGAGARGARRPAVLDRCRLAAFATTAGVPHLDDRTALHRDHTMLHISLRDLGVAIIRSADNIVDDVDDVCRGETSVHLAERAHGDRRFIRCTLGDVLAGSAAARAGTAPVVFSPFGLGVLDLAVGRFVVARARAAGTGITIPKFCPAPRDRTAATVG
jgi:hypothetical protein